MASGRIETKLKVKGTTRYGEDRRPRAVVVRDQCHGVRYKVEHSEPLGLLQVTKGDNKEVGIERGSRGVEIAVE